MGHAFGLGHTSDSTAIMYAFTSFSRCAGGARPLQPDDIAGIRAIYPGAATGVTPPTAAPSNVAVTVNGAASVTVSWNAVAALLAELPAAATSYRLDFRASPTGPAIQSIVATGSSMTVGIPPGIAGTFYVAVTGVNSAGAGPSSAPVPFTIGGGAGCTAAPPAPTGLAGRIVGGTASLSWNASPGATSYVVQAGLAPGASSLFNANVGNLTSISAGGLPAGFRAYVRVIAVNACGQSAPTADLLLQ
jgi:hypothetical protein